MLGVTAYVVVEPPHGTDAVDLGYERIGALDTDDGLLATISNGRHLEDGWFAYVHTHSAPTFERAFESAWETTRELVERINEAYRS